MKVYTKTGDEGQTSLFNGDRVSKNDIRVNAYGTLDECNSALGVACSTLSLEEKSWTGTDEGKEKLESLREQLFYIQNRFFDLGAHLATPRFRSEEEKVSKTSFEPEASFKLENWIDELERSLSPLKTFILPGGHPAAAQLHMARAIARRAERVASVLVEEDEVEPAAFIFINRVSDYFFVAARFVNYLFKVDDVCWQKLN